MSGNMTPFQRKLEERRKIEAAEREAQDKARAEFDDVIPERNDVYELTDMDHELDRVVDGISVLDAYRKWCGKMEPKFRQGQRESIKISCPVPGHLDKNPSAWVNLDKNTWYCASCEMGGDHHDIAAFHFGYAVPAYKTDGSFHDLRIKMAEDYGYRIEKLPGDVKILIAPDSIVETDQPDASTEEVDLNSPDATDSGNVVHLPEEYEDDMDSIEFPPLDWKKVVPVGTFLDSYMKCTTIDDVPEEYHLWCGLLALGFAAGRQVRLDDSIPVIANLFICTLGRSGSGKSKASRILRRLLVMALPSDFTDPSNNGVEMVSTVSSAEALVRSFQKEILKDPSDPKSGTINFPVRGLIEFNELSALISRTNRSGNALKPAMMEFYDGEEVVSTFSLTTGRKEAREPFGSALTTTQPLALKSLIGRTDDDSGFLNRWVFVGGREKPQFAIGGARVDIKPAVEPLKKIVGWAGSFKSDEYVTWSQEAEDTFTTFFHDVIVPDKKASSSALLVRLDLLMKKIILLLAINKREKVVSASTVLDAIEFYDYIKGCYRVPESQIGNTLQSEISEAVLFVARRQYEIDKKGVSLRVIAKALWRRKYPNDLLLKVIDSLVKLNYLEVEMPGPGTRGRPTARYRYVG